MKRFRERNRATTGLVGIVVVTVLIVGALQFPRLPLIHNNVTYQADFANAGGLASGDIVTVNGVQIGTITGMTLEGDFVQVTFTGSGTHLGSNFVGGRRSTQSRRNRVHASHALGPGSIRGPIPVSRTSVPYNLVTALSGLGSEIQHYNIPQLENALNVGSQDLNGTEVSQTTSAFKGLAAISRVIGNEGKSLATIVTQGAALSKVLSQRSHQLFNLFGQSALVLSVLQQRRAAIDQLLGATSTLSAQITSILSVNRPALTTLLQDLQSVSAVLAKDSNDFGQAIPVLAAFSRYSANATGSGAFVDVAVPTLLIPDNLSVQCSKAGSYPSSNPQVGCRP